MPKPANQGPSAPATGWEPRVALGLLIALVCLLNLAWVRQDHSPMLRGDCYNYLARVLVFADSLGLGEPGFWSAADKLSVHGRPPLYQLLTTPFVFLLGRSEDAALAVNFIFLVILMISTYNLAHLGGNSRSGLLAAFVVATYPPLLLLSRAYLPHFAVPACVALSLWLLLKLLTNRSITTAWLFGLSLAFGLLIHPMFAWAAAPPTVIFGFFTLFFQTDPKYPVDLKHAPAWLGDKLRDRFVILGLLPGALVCVALFMPWYLTRGMEIFELLQKISAPDLADFTGGGKSMLGWSGFGDSFWWYVRTTPGAISNVLGLLFVVGLVVSTTRRRLSSWFLVITIISSWSMLSLQVTHHLLYFVSILPVVAVLTTVWIAELRNHRLAIAGTVILIAVAGCNFFLTSWGDQPGGRSLAAALGSPVDDGGACENPVSLAFCPASPIPVDPSPDREVLYRILEDPECREDRPCLLMVVSTPRVMRTRIIYYMIRDRLGRRLRATDPGNRRAAMPYNLSGLLTSDYLLYPDVRSGGGGHNYNAASLRLLRNPPAAFAEAHRTVAAFEFPGVTAKLAQRVRPLTVAEAESSIAELHLDEKYKSKKCDVLTPLYIAEGFLEESIACHDRIQNKRLRRSIRAELLSRHPESIISFYLEAVAAEPGSVAARRQLSRAMAQLKKAIRSAPDNPEPRLHLASIHQSLGETDKARALYREVLRIDPENAVARRDLARLGE